MSYRKPIVSRSSEVIVKYDHSEKWNNSDMPCLPKTIVCHNSVGLQRSIFIEKTLCLSCLGIELPH